MKIYIKTTADGKIIKAPTVYKNISNFNKSKSLMEKYGFAERIVGYKKTDGTMKYIEPALWEQHETYYTEMPYPGADYEWDYTNEMWQIKLDVAKQQKLEQVRQSTNSYMEQLKSNFSNAEMETWGRQENGVRLLLENPESEEYDAQWVKALAATRGISLEEQMQRISYATTMMNTIAYQLVGYQQKLEDMINAATSVDDIMKINFETEVAIANESM